MHIAPIEYDDLESLAALYEQLLAAKSDLARMQAIYRHTAKNPDYYLLGAKSAPGSLVGSILGICCSDFAGDCRPFMVLENMIVSTSCRRQGIGQQLIQCIENIARERNCYYIMLLSNQRRTDAHAFYRNLGYSADLAQGFKKYLQSH